MDDAELANREIETLERAEACDPQRLGKAMHEALRVAQGGLSPWQRSAAGNWVRVPKIGAPVCMVIGSLAILPAGFPMFWEFPSQEEAKAAVDRKLEAFWGELP